MDGGDIISRRFQLICILALSFALISSPAVFAVEDGGSSDVDPSATVTDNNTTNTSGAMWVREWDMDDMNLTQLKEDGITDIFLNSKALSDPNYTASTKSFLDRAQKAGIRVSAWVVCFKSDGKWIDPTGKYSYQVKTSYKGWVKVPYKYWYKAKVKVKRSYYVKKRYYSNGVRKYRWVKKTYYVYKYKWTYKIKYKSVYKTQYKTETKYAYNYTFIQNYKANLISKITNYTKIQGIGGIHLDYLRYPGTAYKSANGTTAITQFVGQVKTAMNTVNPDALLSAALMPETSSNAYYYGQDYAQLGQHLDVLVPMIYKGNYKEDTAWIASVTTYVSSHSGGAKVWAGLMSYESDSNVVPLPAAELLNDVKVALKNGAAGYVLFRYGWINPGFFDLSGAL